MICLRPLQVDNICVYSPGGGAVPHNNIFVFIRQVASIPACWLFKTPATSLTFDLETGVRVTCDVGHLCANFSLPRLLCSRVRPDVCDGQTDGRQTKALLNASTLRGRKHNNLLGRKLRKFCCRGKSTALHIAITQQSAVKQIFLLYFLLWRQTSTHM